MNRFTATIYKTDTGAAYCVTLDRDDGTRTHRVHSRSVSQAYPYTLAEARGYAREALETAPGARASCISDHDTHEVWAIN